ncbi:MAG: rRNA pseudouridine synthase [Atopobiaceae bacterium]|nr:rRNA pseudouridine synthase [Atopobiaceae bacterium]
MSEGERVVPMRLQRFLARAGVASRRGSEKLMTAGRVCVNGEVVTQLGSKVDPACDVVTVDGREVQLAEHATYLILNKPSGYLTTMSDPYGRPCVASLVPTQTYPGLFPVGRLDADTTGILLFTTNGDASQQMLHPSKHVSKHYVATVEGTPTERELDLLRKGIVLDDGPTQPAEVEIMDAARGRERTTTLGITIQEGRKHQVKRMCEAIGHKVVRLHRDSFGPLRLTDCAEGTWRLLTSDEVAKVEALVSS